jgi:hypothetical protein
MAKILTFRNKDGAPSDRSFLTDDNQTLSFRTTEDGGISLGNLSRTGLRDLFPDPKKDWSNQELADLFRVRQLLSGANVPVETDRGVTDEGDPWFVFCHAGGEVFIHLCRIDGLYLLDSPNVLRPLRGMNFNELIADFTNQAMPARESEDETGCRGIKLERGGKIRLHPSAMLAALIWTLFLASEELVLLAPEEEQVLDDDTLLDFDGMFAVETAEDPDMELLFEDDMIDIGSLLKEDAAETGHAAPETQGQMREAMLQQQGLTVQNNAFTMGLSTIAIAMGFMSETVLLDNQRKVLESLKELGFSEYGNEAQRVAELDIPLDEDGNALLAMLADFLGLDLSLNTDLAEAPAAEVDDSQLQQDLAHLMEAGSPAQAAMASVKAANLVTVRDKDLDAEAAIKQVVAPNDALPDPDEETLAAEIVQDASTLTLSEIVQTWRPEMEEFQLGQTTVKASFDMSDTDAFALFDLIDTAANQRLTDFREFDSLAQRLINYLEAKDGEFGIIELANEIIMIDRTAVTGGEIEYMHWETSDGKIISLVGLASDFQQFDMIA